MTSLRVMVRYMLHPIRADAPEAFSLSEGTVKTNTYKRPIKKKPTLDRLKSSERRRRVV